TLPDKVGVKPEVVDQPGMDHLGRLLAKPQDILVLCQVSRQTEEWLAAQQRRNERSCERRLAGFRQSREQTDQTPRQQHVHQVLRPVRVDLADTKAVRES